MEWIDAMSLSRIAWGFGMSAYQNSGVSRQYNACIKNIKLHIVTDIKEKRKCLKRWLPEEEAKGLVAIQALYCLDTPEFW